jgi:hypothetical protein
MTDEEQIAAFVAAGGVKRLPPRTAAAPSREQIRKARRKRRRALRWQQRHGKRNAPRRHEPEASPRPQRANPPVGDAVCSLCHGETALYDFDAAPAERMRPCPLCVVERILVRRPVIVDTSDDRPPWE